MKTGSSYESLGFGKGALKLGASLMVLASVGLAQPAVAQEAVAAEEDEEDAILVTGFRASLQSAQAIKRDSDTIVDSVTAEDIGALPDRSVTEALQRIPGISINRFAAGVDPDHFSVEGSGVVVRGLTYVRSEFNGREAFTANNGRALGFADVPSELLGGVDVYKSPSADRIEGGIAGVVNLRTRLPFDSPGRVIAGSLELNYGDFSKKESPTGAIVLSNRWDVIGGELGLLGSFSYSQLISRADRFQVSSFRPRTLYSDGTRNDVIDFEGATAQGTVLFPRGAVAGNQQFDRERYGYAAAAQWRSDDGRWEATLQFLRSDARQAWTEHVLEIATDNVAGNGDSRAVAGTSFTVDSSGLFDSGMITGPTGWQADQNDESAFGRRVPTLGLQSNNIKRDREERAVTSDYAANILWRATDDLTLVFDYQHVDSFQNVLDNTLWVSTYQDAFIDLDGSRFPTVAFLPPQTCATVPCPGAPGSAPNSPAYYRGDHQSFSDPFNSFYRSAMDHIEGSTGNSDAFRIDGEYSFPNEGFIKSIRAGVRYADRNQTARFSTYNWGVLSEQWGEGGPVWLDDPVDGVPGAGTGGTAPQGYAPFCFDNFFRNSVPNPLNGQCRLFYAGNTAADYDQMVAYANAINREWQATTTTPDGRVINSGWRSLYDRPNVVPGTPYTLGEVNPQQERNKAAYVMLRFENDFDSGATLSGNIGLRYTETRRVSGGYIQYPTAAGLPSTETCRDNINNVLAELAESVTASCALGAQGLANLAAFQNGAVVENNYRTNYDYWLPSLNVKLEVGGGLQFRAAYSKGVAPPDLGLVRNYFPVSVSVLNNVDSSGNNIPIEITPVAPGTGEFGSDGAIAPGQVRVRGIFNAGNPTLLPITANNFDLTAEWYFSNVGQLTGSVFHKRLKNVLTNDIVETTFTNGGQTYEAAVTSPVNSGDTGKITGFEVTYQQTYDFLPSFLSGLGLQANYTYVKSSGVPQSTLSATDPDVGAGRVSTIAGDDFPLQGLSKHTINITPFIDIGPLSARASYNWRSRYLLTLRDVITPFDPIFQSAYGQLDASITWSITDQIKFGVQGVNLLNSVTKTEAAVLDGSGDVRLIPRGWYMNDRRYTAILRFSF